MKHSMKAGIFACVVVLAACAAGDEEQPETTEETAKDEAAMKWQDAPQSDNVIDCRNCSTRSYWDIYWSGCWDYC